MRYIEMIESEVRIFDRKINPHPIDPQNVDQTNLSPFEAAEITSHYKEVRDGDSAIFVRQRKIKRHKSAGIF